MEPVYFEINNWTRGVDYPNDPVFVHWMERYIPKFRHEEWVKDNELCVVYSNIGCSQNFCISAPIKFVLNNCYSLLTRNKNFLAELDKDGKPIPRRGPYYLEYNPSNFGVVFYKEDE